MQHIINYSTVQQFLPVITKVDEEVIAVTELLSSNRNFTI